VHLFITLAAVAGVDISLQQVLGAMAAAELVRVNLAAQQTERLVQLVLAAAVGLVLVALVATEPQAVQVLWSLAT
jgi:hypothetical protein